MHGSTGDNNPCTLQNIAKPIFLYLATSLLSEAMAKTHESCGDASSKLSAPTNPKVKLMCSYGGKIQPRPRDQQLVYVGGDTKLLTVDRNVKFSDLMAKLNPLYNFNSEEVCVKYQLPGEDLDVLISLIDDDDLENMMLEYDRLPEKTSPTIKPARFRLFIFDLNNPAKISSDSGTNAPLNPDYLFGFDKEYDSSIPSGFDMSMWAIPNSVVLENSGSVSVEKNGDGERSGIDVQKTGSIQGHVAVGDYAAAPQFVYRVPFVNTGFHVAQYGMVPIGVANGFREQPVHNGAVPSLAVVAEKMKMAVATVDRAAQQRNV